MYELYYGLKEKPFQVVPNPDYLYLSSKHENALTYLEYGIREGAGFILLTGGIGTGKTTLIRYILNIIEAETEVAVIFNTNVTSEQLIELVLRELEIEPAANNKTKNIDMLYHCLIEKYAQKKKVLLIIDEAQNLQHEVLEEVRMLSNLQTDDNLLLQIMLAGQPELKIKLHRPSLAQLTQRIAVNYHLESLTRKETAEYISSRLKMAGGKTDIFTDIAIDKIYSFTKGIPRSINLLCDTALVYGFAGDVKIINNSIIDQVLEDKGDFGISVDETEYSDVTSKKVKSFPDNSLDSRRLMALESTVQQLKMQVTWQVEELEKRADNFKDDLIHQLREQLDQERQKNNFALVSYGKLKEKYVNLKKQLDTKPETSTVVNTVSRKTKKNKRWFLD
jgi:general secretion pathway protein A